MKNHKQVAVDSNFVINNYKNYATERKQALFKIKPGSEQKVTAQSPAANEQFGYSVVIEGNYAFVGHPFPTSTQPGEVEVYQKSNGTWTFKQVLVASDATNGDQFGYSIDASGTTLAIGAPQTEDNSETNHGAVYIFDLQANGTWTQTVKLTADNKGASDVLGSSVAIDGDVVVAGAENEDTTASNAGAAYVFTRSDGSWSQTVKLVASDGAIEDYFGKAVSLSGDTVLIGAYEDNDNGGNSGSAYIFERDEAGNWTQTAKLTATDGAVNDYFGNAVSLSGFTALIGAPHDDDKGSSSGSAYIFERDETGNWEQTAKLTASDGAQDDYFGSAVSLSGDIALIGARGDHAGTVYVFQKTVDNVWRRIDQVTASDGASNDAFGAAISVSRTSIVVGAIFDDDNGSSSGTAYFYKIEPSEEFATRTPILQPPFSLLTPGVHSLRTK